MFELVKTKKGFTLIEMVVALGIFAIATTYCVSIFVQSNQTQKRTANIYRVLSDTRYTMEVMAREIRLDRIDYQYYQDQGISLEFPLVEDLTTLALTNPSGESVMFRRAVVSDRAVIQMQVMIDDIATWQDITPEDLSIEKLAFYITPDVDPFIWHEGATAYGSNEQPKVTIVLQAKSLHPDLTTEKIFNLQTTISTRTYSR